MDMIVVEYSSDMRRWAQRLGGSLSMDGYTVIYKQVEGVSVLRFRVNGSVYSVEEFRYMVNYVLNRSPGRRAGAGARG